MYFLPDSFKLSQPYSAVSFQLQMALIMFPMVGLLQQFLSLQLSLLNLKDSMLQFL